MSEGQIKTYHAYGRSTFIYDSYIPRADYEEGSRRLTSLIQKHNPGARSLLDVGCGSGKYLDTLQHTFDCEGLDLSDGFLEIARKRCPHIRIHKGNMTDFDLGRRIRCDLLPFRRHCLRADGGEHGEGGGEHGTSS